MNQAKIALTLLGLAAELLEKGHCCCGVKETPKPKKQCDCGCGMHSKPNFDREPDGVHIVVDRPRIEDYYSRHAWAQDMANYRGLIDQAKKCERIKTRKPDFIPSEVHNARRDWYDDHGQGLKDIKRTVSCDRNPFIGAPSPSPRGIRAEVRVTGFDPDDNWF